MLQVLATDTRTSPERARIVLRTQIVPKRQLVIRVSEDVQALNRSAFVKQQSDIAQVYGGTQRQLWEISASRWRPALAWPCGPRCMRAASRTASAASGRQRLRMPASCSICPPS